MLTLTQSQTEEILNKHIYAFAQGDVAAIMADYAEEAVFFTPEGARRGQVEIRSMFEQLLTDFPPGSAVELHQQIIEGETAYVVWSGESERLKIPFATDTLLVRDGKIVMQSFAAHVEAKLRSNGERGQVNTRAAEVYDAFFVPALFQEWAGRMVEAAQVQPGQRVLDVGCGTGVFTRAAAERVGPAGEIIGLDINEGMLAVARRKAPHIEWRSGPAEALPFEDNRFDAVACQFALMFFAERRAALREMVRVLRPGGWLAVAVWDTVENTPGYSAMVGLLQRLFGAEAANALRAPFNLGDTQLLREIFTDAGLPEVKITSLTGTARFESIAAWVTTEIKGWTLADRLDDDQFEQLLAAAESVLQPFVRADGTVAFEAPAHIVTAMG